MISCTRICASIDATILDRIVIAALSMMMVTLERKKSPRVPCGYDSPVRAGPARVKDAGPASGPLRPLVRGQGNPSGAPGSEVIASGETIVCQSSEGKRKNRTFNALVSWFDRVCLAPHVSLFNDVRLWVRSVFLCVVEFFGGYTDSDDTHRVHVWPQSFPQRPCTLRQHL